MEMEFFCWGWERQSAYDLLPGERPHPFSLPSPLPHWPQGKGFGKGRICLGEIEVIQITQFEKIWSLKPSFGRSTSATFYKPVDIPKEFSVLGHYCQLDNKPLSGYVLAARDSSGGISASTLPPLEKPLGYTLVWTANTLSCTGTGYIWLPNPPNGYKPMGYLVTIEPDEPNLEDAMCVRADLTEPADKSTLIFATTTSIFSKNQFQVWTTTPSKRGIEGKGVPVGTFFCGKTGDDISIASLKNSDSAFQSMPNLDQIHALIKEYGPTVFFHPNEAYLPSSVPWFFENGALLYKTGDETGSPIDPTGRNLPAGGKNDREFWIDLPPDEERRAAVKAGNIGTAVMYVHVKPASGGTETDIVMWIFCPFNGPATLKVGLVSYDLTRVGEHVSDWEHFTLRVSNFSGRLRAVFFSEHSGGEWVPVDELEFGQGNRVVVYSSRNGHASFPRPGCFIQGSSVLGIGARNDCDRSGFSVDSSSEYELVAAEFLGEGVVAEPDWLQFMREWGPRVEYDSASEVDKIINRLPFYVRFSVESLFELFPTELYGEEGPTGPKEKENWLGDERC